MSAPTLLFLDPDVNFLKRLAKTFYDFGFHTICKTSIQSVTELLEIKQSLAAVVCNLEVGQFEGLTIHASLKNHQRFAEIPFVFIANEPEVYEFIKNMSLDESVILQKSMDMREITSEILNVVKDTSEKAEELDSIVVGKGNFSEMVYDDLFSFCQKNAFTGVLTVKNTMKTAVIVFATGQVKEVLLGDFPKKEALRKIKNLNGATYLLEQKVFNFVVDNMGNSLLLNEEAIGVQDVLVDLFYFVHNYFEEKVGLDETHLIFKTKFSEYQQNFDWFTRVCYVPDIQEKVSITGNIFGEQLDGIILLLKEVFAELSCQNGNISMEQFLSNLQELKPYLLQFDLWNKLIFTEIPHY